MKWYDREASSGLIGLVLILFIMTIAVWAYVLPDLLRFNNKRGELEPQYRPTLIWNV